MIKVGKPPYLECSSRGDKRFSAFYARIKRFGNRSIEEIYQGAKIFEDGSTNLTIQEAKGKKAINMDKVAKLYDRLWWVYLSENPELIEVIYQYNGFSDAFGKDNCQCQAKSIMKCKEYNIKEVVCQTKA